MKKLFLPTQRYDVPPSRVEKRFVWTITVELDRIQNQKWNAERAIIFQTVILQRVRLVPGAKTFVNGLTHILTRLQQFGTRLLHRGTI